MIKDNGGCAEPMNKSQRRDAQGGEWRQRRHSVVQARDHVQVRSWYRLPCRMVLEGKGIDPSSDGSSELDIELVFVHLPCIYELHRLRCMPGVQLCPITARPFAFDFRSTGASSHVEVTPVLVLPRHRTDYVPQPAPCRCPSFSPTSPPVLNTIRGSSQPPHPGQPSPPKLIATISTQFASSNRRPCAPQSTKSTPPSVWRSVRWRIGASRPVREQPLEMASSRPYLR